jgi:hypothetical protein
VMKRALDPAEMAAALGSEAAALLLRVPDNLTPIQCVAKASTERQSTVTSLKRHGLVRVSRHRDNLSIARTPFGCAVAAALVEATER